jgi:hypothetical protein
MRRSEWNGTATPELTGTAAALEPKTPDDLPRPLARMALNGAMPDASLKSEAFHSLIVSSVVR